MKVFDKYLLKSVVLSVFVCFFLIESVSAERGRVKIQNNNVVADNGSALRGAPFFLDIFGMEDMVNNEQKYEEYFKKVATEYNMNLVRCAPWIGNWGFMIKGDQWYENHKSLITFMLDRCVDWAEENGIYAVINMHTKYGTYVDIQKTKDFWGLFASRYKEKSHVLYELINEPDINSVKRNMGVIYEYVRNKAPNTHLILWSLNDPEKISTNDIWNSSDKIDYSNASVGWHSYETILGKTLRWELAEDYRDNGLPVINTEFYSMHNADYYPIDYKYLVDNIRMGEERNMSWMQWAPVFNYGSSNREISHDDIKFSDKYKNRVRNGYNGVPGLGYYWERDYSGASDAIGNNPSPIGGKKRVKDAWKGRYLHATSLDDYSLTQSAPFEPDWGSQKWSFELVDGDKYRIKNEWTGKYLSAPSENEWDVVLTATLNPSWTSQQWAIETVGDDKYRIKNVWSGFYLHTTEGDWDAMLQAPLNTGWSSQKFVLEGF